MATVISSSLVLSRQNLVDPNSPRLCYENLINESNISASAEDATTPAINMANPSTAFIWRATTSSNVTITIDVGGREMDYIGIARHNLDESGRQVRIRAVVGSSTYTIVDYKNIPSGNVYLELLNPLSPDTLMIDISNSSGAPSIGALYVGSSTKIQRNIYVGHTPINYGRNTQALGNVSESGQYLGEIVRRRTYTTQVALQNLTPAWYREELDPWFAMIPRKPAFWAWRPGSYPNEVGYVWLQGDPRPSNQRSNGMMSVSFSLEGMV